MILRAQSQNELTFSTTDELFENGSLNKTAMNTKSSDSQTVFRSVPHLPNEQWLSVTLQRAEL